MSFEPMVLLLTTWSASAAPIDVAGKMVEYAKRCRVPIAFEDGFDARADEALREAPLDDACPETGAGRSDAVVLSAALPVDRVVVRTERSPFDVVVDPVPPEAPTRETCWQALDEAFAEETGWHLVEAGPAGLGGGAVERCFDGEAPVREQVERIFAQPGAAISWVARAAPDQRLFMVSVLVVGGDIPAASPDPELDRIFRERMDADDEASRALVEEQRRALTR